MRQGVANLILDIEIDVTDIRTKIESTVVRPIFDSVRPNGSRDQSLPEVVFSNRKNRAYARVVDALFSRGAPTVPEDLRTRLESMIETWSTQAFDDTFRPIQEFEIQCARERDLVAAEQSGDSRRVLDVLETEYRRRVIDRFSSVEVYVQPYFEQLRPFELSRRMPISDIVQENARLLLIGPPGSGKSTLLSSLANGCAVRNHGLSWPDSALPFVTIVRELKDAELSPQWFAAQLEAPPEVVSAALSQERAVLLVDGLDEAPEDLRKQLVAGLARFTEEYPNTPVIVTSRPAGSHGEIESCLPGFQGFRLADLTDSEVDQFIDGWCLAAERSAQPNSSEARKQAIAAAADLKSRIARSRPVQRIAVNPLLTTILCVVHRFLGRTIPEHRVTLYQKCTEALLYEWDRAKFPKDAAVGNLDANQKRVLLSGIACALHEAHEAEISESDVVRHFASMLPQMGKLQEDALRIVREIRDRSGLLVERRHGVFAFSHLTFQEYLTALDYASRSEQLLEHLDDPWWHEVIALAAGVPGCDPGDVIRALLRKKDRESVVVAAKCVETAINVPLDLRTKVDNALEGILPPKDWDDVIGLLEIGRTVAPILARGLAGYHLSGMVYSLDFFRLFEYEPVIPLLIQRVADTRIANFVFENLRGYHPTVGDWSLFVLRSMARTSDGAKRALLLTLARRPSDRFVHEILKPWEVLGDDFKPLPPGKHSPKRAKSTV
jgi:energy-coupling factor transporter ATP-binding protein EcfA2